MTPISDQELQRRRRALASALAQPGLGQQLWLDPLAIICDQSGVGQWRRERSPDGSVYQCLHGGLIVRYRPGGFDLPDMVMLYYGRRNHAGDFGASTLSPALKERLVFVKTRVMMGTPQPPPSYKPVGEAFSGMNSVSGVRSLVHYRSEALELLADIIREGPAGLWSDSEYAHHLAAAVAESPEGLWPQPGLEVR